MNAGVLILLIVIAVVIIGIGWDIFVEGLQTGAQKIYQWVKVIWEEVPTDQPRNVKEAWL